MESPCEWKGPPGRDFHCSRQAGPRILHVVRTTTVVVDLRVEKIDLSTQPATDESH